MIGIAKRSSKKSGVPGYCIIANTGGTGNAWFKDAFDKLPDIYCLVRNLPNLTLDEYQIISTNALSNRLLEQGIEYRVKSPLSCLFDEMQQFYPNKKSYCALHFHTANSLLSIRNKFREKLRYKVLYTYGSPLKRLRADMKFSTSTNKLRPTELDSLVSQTLSNPLVSDILKKTSGKLDRKSVV